MVSLLAFVAILPINQRHSTAPLLEFKIPAGVAIRMSAAHAQLHASSRHATYSELKDVSLELPSGCKLTVKGMTLTETKSKDGSIVIRSALAGTASALKEQNLRLRAKLEEMQADVGAFRRASEQLKRANETLDSQKAIIDGHQ